MPLLCPACGAAVVWVGAARWDAPLDRGRSVWLDAPEQCRGGCALTPPQVQRVLERAYRHEGDPLPLVALEPRIAA